ncbi:cardiotrophin-like cytokine factor 1 isoform X3 [Xenopus laevis]|uniref:Cardiotrophin-like cytokine factor 1 n=1 Tax=Xenopus laevis TaxID=8355 RepID=A0A8J1LC58_XENLA|nr:cardiotrophin-like cytokine factor 1 isoform X3 [Xenopus laevis]
MLLITDPLARTSIQKSYDLTKYLEHQLRSLAGPYLNYLGPPFNDPDFNPPRAGGTETIPSASVDFHLWRNLNDGLRLAENHRAYSLLLCYLQSIDEEVVRTELRRSLGQFCTSLQGLLVSIAGVMSSLGYQPPQELVTSYPPIAMGFGRGNDFLRKMEDFWLLKELQIWLWRSAKDFNRLKRKVPAVVAFRMESREL